ncbi:MAG: hypothetical protein JKX83_07385 [Pseudomonadales bacterium]|nr:hypothetical protein [Pseudomonadales bacterium]
MLTLRGGWKLACLALLMAQLSGAYVCSADELHTRPIKTQALYQDADLARLIYLQTDFQIV